MTNLRKAAEQAAIDLEELIHWHGVRDSNDKLMPAHNQTPEIKSAIESLEALSQALAQPEQEPVAWMHKEKGKPLEFYMPDEGEDCENCEHCIPLYTAPPKREWQGLTDEEIKEIIGPWGDTPIKGYTRQLFDKIEAKLKEKNT